MCTTIIHIYTDQLTKILYVDKRGPNVPAKWTDSKRNTILLIVIDQWESIIITNKL